MKLYQILFGMLVGILLCLLWLNEPEVIPDPDLVQVKRQYIESIFSKFHSKIVHLQQQNDSLSDALVVNKRKLQDKKSSYGKSREILVKKVEALNVDSVGKHEVHSIKGAAYTVFNDFDSLECVYENRIFLLESLVAVKDTEFTLCRKNVKELEDLLQQQLRREQQLTLELNTAYKVQKKKVREHKLLSGGMLVLSGIATTIYINSRK